MIPRLLAAAIRCLPATVFALLAGCHAASTRVPAPEHTPAPASAGPEDVSYDWHVLLIAPFGSTLKDIPLMLHEVLMFRDEAHGATELNDAECYAPDQAAPHFMGRAPDEYLLCFNKIACGASKRRCAWMQPKRRRSSPQRAPVGCSGRSSRPSPRPTPVWGAKAPPVSVLASARNRKRICR